MKASTIVLMLGAMFLVVFFEQTGSVVKEDVKEITIFAEKWEFVPNEIEVKQGDEVRLKLVTSEENETFGFKLSSYMYNNIAIIESGNATYVDVVASRPGVFTYRCETPCGWGKNLMIGKFIVKPF